MSKRNSLKLLIAMFVGYRIAEKNFKEVLDRVSTYKSEVSSLMTIGRQNAINDIENELRSARTPLRAEAGSFRARRNKNDAASPRREE